MGMMATASSGSATCAVCVATRPRHRSSVDARRSSGPYVVHMCSCSAPGFMLDARHTEFRRQHAGRRWTVYIGANDGMLHAFDVRTGSERFAVMPDAALPTVTRNIFPGQPAPAPVCRRPFATDAWTGAQWRSVLACATGAMAPGLFLVDVTNPDADSASPACL